MKNSLKYLKPVIAVLVILAMLLAMVPAAYGMQRASQRVGSTAVRSLPKFKPAGPTHIVAPELVSTVQQPLDLSVKPEPKKARSQFRKKSTLKKPVVGGPSWVVKQPESTVAQEVETKKAQAKKVAPLGVGRAQSGFSTTTTQILPVFEGIDSMPEQFAEFNEPKKEIPQPTVADDMPELEVVVEEEPVQPALPKAEPIIIDVEPTAVEIENLSADQAEQKIKESAQQATVTQSPVDTPEQFQQKTTRAPEYSFIKGSRDAQEGIFQRAENNVGTSEQVASPDVQQSGVIASAAPTQEPIKKVEDNQVQMQQESTQTPEHSYIKDAVRSQEGIFERAENNIGISEQVAAPEIQQSGIAASAPKTEEPAKLVENNQDQIKKTAAVQPEIAPKVEFERGVVTPAQGTQGSVEETETTLNAGLMEKGTIPAGTVAGIASTRPSVLDTAPEKIVPHNAPTQQSVVVQNAPQDNPQILRGARQPEPETIKIRQTKEPKKGFAKKVEMPTPQQTTQPGGNGPAQPQQPQVVIPEPTVTEIIIPADKPEKSKDFPKRPESPRRTEKPQDPRRLIGDPEIRPEPRVRRPQPRRNNVPIMPGILPNPDRPEPMEPEYPVNINPEDPHRDKPVTRIYPPVIKPPLVPPYEPMPIPIPTPAPIPVGPVVLPVQPRTQPAQPQGMPMRVAVDEFEKYVIADMKSAYAVRFGKQHRMAGQVEKHTGHLVPFLPKELVQAREEFIEAHRGNMRNTDEYKECNVAAYENVMAEIRAYRAGAR